VTAACSAVVIAPSPSRLRKRFGTRHDRDEGVVDGGSVAEQERRQRLASEARSSRLESVSDETRNVRKTSRRCLPTMSGRRSAGHFGVGCPSDGPPMLVASGSVAFPEPAVPASVVVVGSPRDGGRLPPSATEPPR
jgi:hypothetical protein